MNSGPNNDSKQCSESKLDQVHSVHTHPNLRALAPCSGHALAMSWPGPAVSWSGPPALSQCMWLCRGPVPRAHMAVSWPRSRYSPSSAYCPPVIIHCSVLRYTPQLPALLMSRYDQVYRDMPQPTKPVCLSRYNPCIATQFPQSFKPFSHDTNFVL